MINFYDKNREIVMKLTDFASDSEIETRLKFSANISYAIYTAKREVDDFKIYFTNFLNELKLLYDNKIEAAQYVPLEREIEIYFKQLELGHIIVTIKINHSVPDYVLCNSSLIIQYEIDQSFLPELIQEIEAVSQQSW